jgi:hypothetical protein
MGIVEGLNFVGDISKVCVLFFLIAHIAGFSINQVQRTFKGALHLPGLNCTTSCCLCFAPSFPAPGQC